MTIRRHVLVLAALLIAWQTTAQQVDLSFVKRIIQAKYSVNLDTLDLCDMVILNGIPYDSLAIDEEVGKIDLNQLLITMLANLSSSNFFHAKCSHVIVLGTQSNQSNDDKKALLDSIKNNLNANVPELIVRDQACNQCKLVVVDGRALDMHESKRMVNRLRVRDVRHIATFDSPDPLIYGERAKGGLVEIFLKRGRGKKN